MNARFQLLGEQAMHLTREPGAAIGLRTAFLRIPSFSNCGSHAVNFLHCMYISGCISLTNTSFPMLVSFDVIFLVPNDDFLETGQHVHLRPLESNSRHQLNGPNKIKILLSDVLQPMSSYVTPAANAEKENILGVKYWDSFQVDLTTCLTDRPLCLGRSAMFVDAKRVRRYQQIGKDVGTDLRR